MCKFTDTLMTGGSEGICFEVLFYNVNSFRYITVCSQYRGIYFSSHGEMSIVFASLTGLKYMYHITFNWIHVSDSYYNLCHVYRNLIKLYRYENESCLVGFAIRGPGRGEVRTTNPVKGIYWIDYNNMNYISFFATYSGSPLCLQSSRHFKGRLVFPRT